MKRSATAIWKGGPRAGEGTVTTSSGVLNNVLYRVVTSAVEVPCTTPGEMLVASEAACMSLTVANELAVAGATAESVETEAELTVAIDSRKNMDITGIHLKVTVNVPGLDAEAIKHAVSRAKNHCLIARALKPKITCETHVITGAEAVAAK
jgi:osmotically inducible protein OsmC